MKWFLHPTAVRRERGQGMVEFAFSVTIMVLILMGIVDLGRAYYIYVALTNAAGEGAAYASMNPNCLSCSDPNNVNYRVRNESLRGIIQTDNIESVTVTTSGTPQMGSPVRVVVTYRYDFITPYLPALGFSTITLRAAAEQPFRVQP